MHVQHIVEQLSFEKHRNTTRETYHRIWKLFNQFFVKLDVKPCSWEDRLVLFTGFLVHSKLKSSTVKSYISAFRAVLAELGERINPDNYRLKSLTRACRLRNDVIVHKLLITKGVLKLLLDVVKNIFGAEQPYLLAMYLALFSTVYHSLFKIGEIASGPHVILAKNVHIGENKNKMLFILQSSKTHGKGDKPQIVKIISKPMQGKKKERENTL